jgi:hypothetical protein
MVDEELEEKNGKNEILGRDRQTQQSIAHGFQKIALRFFSLHMIDVEVNHLEKELSM